MGRVAGLDVGGAHLKVALAVDGLLTAVEQFVCPLWQGFGRLDQALAAAAPLLQGADKVAVTMTGELSDLFPNRREGVARIVARLVREHGPAVRFWLGTRGFGSADEARAHPADAGSTNFLATATWIASQPRCATSLLVDFGSTTADIIPIVDGQPVPRGLSDAERQATGELVYTGFTRTAVMGVADRAPFDGQWVTLAREYLATMADIRRILGDDVSALDLHATADGKGKSLQESRARFARMLGRDADDCPPGTLEAAAGYVRELQRRSLIDGIMQVTSAAPLPPDAPLVAAGIGATEVYHAAHQLDHPCILFGSLLPATDGVQQAATHHAPAVAIALLAHRR